MIKWGAILLLLFFSLPTHGQYYISGLGDAEIDRLQEQYDSLFSYGRHEQTEVYTDKLLQYWSEQKSKSKDLDTANNYYYSLLESYNCKLRNTASHHDTLLVFIQKIDSEIISTFGSNHQMTAYYYDLLGYANGKIKTNNKQSLSYFLKAKKIKEKLPAAFDLSRANTLDGIGNSYINSKELTLAKASFEEALAIRNSNTPTDSVGIAYSMYRLGRVYERENKLELSFKNWKQAAEIIKRHRGEQHELYLLTQFALGVYYNRSGSYENTLKTAYPLLEIYRKIYGESSKLNKVNNLLINALSRTNRVEEAIKIANQNLQNLQRENTTIGIAGVYNSLGHLSSDLPEKLKYLEKAVYHCPNDSKCSELNRAIQFRNIAFVHSQKGDPNSAINYLNKAKEILESNLGAYGYRISNTYTGLAVAYQSLENYEDSKYYSYKALASIKKYASKNKDRIALALSNCATQEMKVKDFTKAEKLLIEAIKLQNAPNSRKEYKAYTYNQLGALYESKSQMKQALDAYKKSHDLFVSVSGKSNHYSQNSLFDLAEFYLKIEQRDSCKIAINEILNHAGFIDFESEKINDYKIGSDNLWESFYQYSRAIELDSELNDALQPFLKEKILTGFKLIEELKSSFYFESSEVKFQKQTRLFYNWALLQLSTLYQQKKSIETLALIFDCIEKSKSITTQRTVERDKAIASGLVTKEIVRQEKGIITDYEKAYQKYLNNTRTENDSLTKALADEMYGLEKEKDLFLDSLAEQFPAYFQKRYEQKGISLREAKKLSKDIEKGIISYHWGDSLLYRFIITPEETTFDFTLIEQVEQPLKSFQKLFYQKSRSQEKDYLNNKKLFVEKGHELYELLLKKELLLPEELVIIPSGPLTQIPFDCLLTSKVNASSSYKILPYFLRKHIISYLGSTTLLSDLQTENRPQNEKEYLGFGPNLKLANNQNQLATNRNFTPSDLLYNEEEIRQTSSLFDGNKFLGKYATEQSFNKNASQYRILHLAMHARLNNLISQDSYLSFAPDSLQKEDGQLRISEIAKMDLNNDLVVLSACETNVGKQNHGEGILGIARAFQFASCRNIVMSNWLVDDRSSSQLIFSFFKGFRNNTNPAAALRNAKLDFLENCSTVHSHPGYWAAFSYYGNSDSLRGSQSSNLIFWIGIGFICLLFLVGLKLFLK